MFGSQPRHSRLVFSLRSLSCYLAFQTIKEGLVLLGSVASIHEDQLIISLPFLLKGRLLAVHLCKAYADIYTNRISSTGSPVSFEPVPNSQPIVAMVSIFQSFYGLKETFFKNHLYMVWSLLLKRKFLIRLNLERVKQNPVPHCKTMMSLVPLSDSSLLKPSPTSCFFFFNFFLTLQRDILIITRHNLAGFNFK